MKIILYTIFVFSFICGCSSTNYVSTNNKTDQLYNSVNYLGERYSSKIVLLDKTVIECDYLHLTKDTLLYGDDELSITKIPLNKVNKVTLKDKTASFFSAFWIGLGTGVLAMLTASLTNDCKSCHPNLLPLLYGIIAAPIGFIAGYLLSGEREFVFNEMRQS